MRRLGLFGCVLTLGLSLASSARADDAGVDEIALKSGGSIRGTVLVSEPGKTVSIAVMGEAQPRVVPWSEIDRLDRGKYATASPTSTPPVAPDQVPPAPVVVPAPAPAPPPHLGQPGVVRVHIDSPVPVSLVHDYLSTYPVTESRVDGYGNIVSRDALAVAKQSDSLCSSPCDKILQEAPLRIEGDAMPSSASFDFTTQTGDVTITVRPGDNPKYRGGIASIVLGSVAIAAGAAMIAVNETSSTTTDANTGAKVKIPNPALRAGGIVVTSAGVVALGGGIALVVAGRTKVTFSLEPAPAGAHGELKPRYWLGEF